LAGAAAEAVPGEGEGVVDAVVVADGAKSVSGYLSSRMCHSLGAGIGTYEVSTGAEEVCYYAREKTRMSMVGNDLGGAPLRSPNSMKPAITFTFRPCACYKKKVPYASRQTGCSSGVGGEVGKSRIQFEYKEYSGKQWRRWMSLLFRVLCLACVNRSPDEKP
ncbi:hypothetical protein CI238_04954, partial [Colletotrichum incanum]